MKLRHPVMWSINLPLALPDRARHKNRGHLIMPLYRIDFRTKCRMKPSFGCHKSKNILKNIKIFENKFGF
jgi:hypothetical protein